MAYCDTKQLLMLITFVLFCIMAMFLIPNLQLNKYSSLKEPVNKRMHIYFRNIIENKESELLKGKVESKIDAIITNTEITAADTEIIAATTTTTTTTRIPLILDPSVKEIRKFTSDNILISFYTSFFGTKPWDYFLNHKNYNQTCGCSLDKCELNYDNSRWKESDIVFFHGRDMPSVNVLNDLKQQGKAGQLWVYFIMENPFNAPSVTPLNHLFELTSTFRYSSDMFFPYGYYVELSEQEKIEAQNANRNYAQGKTKNAIAWMVSHCGTRRDRLAHKFEALGMPIHVAGGCANQFNGRLQCADRACTDSLKQYKFYFSAENNLCDNYITEKYWRNPFEVDAIPIVLGGSKYSDPHLAIPGSFINALDFNSPKELVDHLKKVGSDDVLYNQYFEWKKLYKVRSEPYGCSSDMCKFCDKLKNGIKIRKNALVTNIDLAKECYSTEGFFDQWINR